MDDLADGTAGKGISRAEYGFISRESADWVERGIIDERARESIVSLYRESERQPGVVAALGAVLVCAGAASFAAAMWGSVPRVVRVALLCSGYLAFAAAAAREEARGGGRSRLRSLLLALSGAALYLALWPALGETALTGPGFHRTLGIWLAAFAPTALLSSSLAPFVLYSASAAVYTASALLIEPWRGLGFFSAVAELWEVSAVTVTTLGAAVFRIRLHGREARLWLFAANFQAALYAGWLCRLALPGGGVWRFLAGVAAYGAVLSCLRRRLGDAVDAQGAAFVSLSGGVMTITSSWIWPNGLETAGPLLTTAALAAFLIRRAASGGGSLLPAMTFCALALRWFFSLTYGYIGKSLFFTLSGAALIAFAAAYRRLIKLLPRHRPPDVPESTPAIARLQQLPARARWALMMIPPLAALTLPNFWG